ncbi:MAG: hypothetical protein EXX96DRAFT_572134 [Benjaminiella poitrasii]|nr:MAG: hypothetical protein EXX96DRAFT_572134 [Benjaminiella poitrasii]
MFIKQKKSKKLDLTENTNHQQQMTSTILSYSMPFTTDMNESVPEELANLEKRTAHNALERQRREGLNSKFQELAHILPSLQQIRRPSKTMIVSKSLEFVSTAKEREIDFKDRIQALRRENEQLMRQASLSEKRIQRRLEQEKILQARTKKQHTPLVNKVPDQSIHIPKEQKSHSLTKANRKIKTCIPKRQAVDIVVPDHLDTLSDTKSMGNSRNLTSKRSREAMDAFDKTLTEISTSSADIMKKKKVKVEMPSTGHIQDSSGFNNGTTSSIPVSSPHHQDTSQSMEQGNVSSHHGHAPLTDNLMNHVHLPHSSVVTGFNTSLPLSFNRTHTENSTIVSPGNQYSLSTPSFGDHDIAFSNNFEHIVSSIPAIRTPVGNSSNNTQQSYQLTTTDSFDVLNTIMQKQSK